MNDPVSVHFLLTPDHRRQLRLECVKRDQTVSAVMRRLVSDQLKQWRDEPVRHA